jgi:DNA-binding NarL/FixJ family response regulator
VIEGLTAEHIRLAGLLARGCTRAYAAHIMGTSAGTVHRMTTQMFDITGTTNVVSLVGYLVYRGVIIPKLPEETQ